MQKVCTGRVPALVPHHRPGCRFLDNRDQSKHAAAGAGVSNTYTCATFTLNLVAKPPEMGGHNILSTFMYIALLIVIVHVQVRE